MSASDDEVVRARAAEERFRTLVDGVGAIVWEAIPGSRPGEATFTFVSEHTEALLGYPSSRWLEDPGFWLSIIHPDDRERVVALVLEGAAGGRQIDFEFRARHADGRLVWLRDIVRVDVPPEGGTPRMSGVVVDITPRRAAQERAEEASALLAAVIDAAPEGFALFDRDLRYVRVNDALAAINGLPPEEHIGRSITEVVPDLPEEGLLRPLRKVLETGEAISEVEVTGRTAADPDADRTWLVSYYPIQAADGRVGWLGAIVLDITERKRAEQRVALLGELATILDEVAGVEHRLARLARALAGRVGEMCTFVLRGEDGEFERIAVAHVDPAAERAMERIAPPTEAQLRNLPGGGVEAIVLDDIDDAMLERMSLGPEQLELRRITGLRCALVVPLVIRGRRIGHLSAGARRPRAFGEHDLALAREVAARAATAIENARLLESERVALERIARLHAATAALAQALTPEEVARVVVDAGAELLGASLGSVWALDEDGTSLELIGHRGYAGERVEAWRRLAIEDPSPLAEAVRREETIWVPGRDGEHHLLAVPLAWRGRRIGALALSFARPQGLTDEERGFVTALAAQFAQAVERAQLYEAQRRVAVTLQRSLLPGRLPPFEDAALAVRYLPAAGLEAGGDFYEALELPDGRIGFAVGDVVGRGTEAAATMGQLRSALRAFALSGDPPATVLGRLSSFAETVEGAMAATAIYGLLDTSSGTLTYACAGHPWPLLARAGGGTDFLRDGRALPLACSPEPGDAEGLVRMRAGDTLLLYTDGLTDRRGEGAGEAFERLREAVAAAHGRDLDEVLDSVVTATGGDDVTDDVALLAVRLTATRARPRVETLPARPESVGPARALMREWLEIAGVPEELATDVLLAAGEAVANAVEHAYRGGEGGVFELSSAWTPDEIEVSVRDHGRWDSGASDSDRGRGLGLMRALMEHVEVDAGEHGTTIRMRRRIEPAAPGTPAPEPRAAPGELRLEVEPGDGAVVARVTGDIDAAVAAELGRRLRAETGTGPMILDLSGVPYLDSAGAEMLVGLARELERLEVVAPVGTPPRRMLEVAGLLATLRVRGT